MKVREFLKKVNYKTAKIPVYLENCNGDNRRKAISFDFAGYYSEEAEKTVKSIDLRADEIIVQYK